MVAEVTPATTWEVREGDCLHVLRELPENSVELVCTDPPYGIGFMGRDWDKSLPDPAVWRECLRVLKPGAFAFVMAGARSDCLWRMCRDLEEAGFSLALSPLCWVYRSGFPKSLNVSKDFDKAAFVEWCNAIPEGEEQSRAQLMGWGAEEVRKAASAAIGGVYSGNDENANRGQYVGHGQDTPGENERQWTLDDNRSAGTLLLSSLLARFGPAPGVRVKVGEKRFNPRDAQAYTRHSSRGIYGTAEPEQPPENITAPSTPLAHQWSGWHSPGLKPAFEFILVAQKPYRGPVRENVREWGVGAYNVEEARVPFAEGDGWAKNQGSTICGKPVETVAEHEWGLREVEKASSDSGRYPANLLVTSSALGPSASRYFDLDAWAVAHGIAEECWQEAAQAGLVQVAKPSKGEKEAGCEGFEEHCFKLPGKATGYNPLTGELTDGYTGNRHNPHPTVKPLRLMSYLIHLACPPGGLVLDPFCGSGTTIAAAVAGGWRGLGIELDPGYCEIARARVAHAEQGRKLTLL